MTTSPAYAIAYLRNVDHGPEIEEYLRRIDDTLTAYDGQFVIHGGRKVPLEGEWDGDIVMISFPSLQAATEWFESPAYQAIAPLRTEHSESIAVLVEGIPPGSYQASTKADELFSTTG